MGGRLDAGIIGYERQVAGQLPPSLIVAAGAASIRMALAQKATFRGHKVFLSNMDVSVRIGHWKVPPGLKLSKAGWRREEIFAPGVARWREWRDRLFGPGPVDQAALRELVAV